LISFRGTMKHLGCHPNRIVVTTFIPGTYLDKSFVAFHEIRASMPFDGEYCL
jgi:hypothetical protein